MDTWPGLDRRTKSDAPQLLRLWLEQEASSNKVDVAAQVKSDQENLEGARSAPHPPAKTGRNPASVRIRATSARLSP
jgi:hypothetical protein